MKKGKSLRQQTKKLQISLAYLSMILSGQRNPNAQFKDKLYSLGMFTSEARLCLEGRNSTTELLPRKAKRSQVFTTQLLEKFIKSRPSGTSPKTIGVYHLALDNFIGYPITPEGINAYLNSLSCFCLGLARGDPPGTLVLPKPSHEYVDS